MKFVYVCLIILLLLFLFYVFHRKDSLEQYKSLVDLSAQPSLETSFQDPAWFQLHKDNFRNSWRAEWGEPPEFIIASDGFPVNFATEETPFLKEFFRNQIIRFGTISETPVEFTLPAGGVVSVPLFVITFPAGLRVYHGGRAVALNHSTYPIRGYDDALDVASNKLNLFSNVCDENKRLANPAGCTTISYYTLPDQNKEYVLGGEYIDRSERSSYRYLDDDNDAKKNLYNLPSDSYINSGRSNVLNPDGTSSSIQKMYNKGDFYSHQLEGELAYKFKSDTQMLLLGFSTLFSNTTNLGRLNAQRVQGVFQQFFGAGLNDYYNAITGNGTLFENFQLFYSTRDAYEQILYVDKLCKTFIYYYNKILNNKTPSPLAQQYFDFSKKFLFIQSQLYFNTLGMTYEDYYTSMQSKILNYNEVVTLLNEAYSMMQTIPGQRVSTYTADRVVLNHVQKMFLNTPIKGFVSTAVFNLVKPIFHQELALFYSPEVIEKDVANMYDTGFAVNPSNLMQEARKYRTTNIQKLDGTGWHQGHPYEHASWVALNMNTLSNNLQSTPSERRFNILLGLYHDIGKTGKCNSSAGGLVAPYWSYKNYNLHELKLTVCDQIQNEDENFFEFFDIPDHPERGYRVLIDLEPYSLFNYQLAPSSTMSLSSVLLNTFGTPRDLSRFRIAEACHWLFGAYLLANYNLLVASPNRFRSLCDRYLERIELYYRYEMKIFSTIDTNDFNISVKDCVLIGLADVLGSKYNPVLKDLPELHLYNEFPNSFATGYPPAYVLQGESGIPEVLSADELISRSMDLLKYLQDYVKGVGAVPNPPQFRMNPKNNYQTLEVMMNYCLTAQTLKTMYPSYFPRVIAFDLDSTLINWGKGYNKFTGPDYQWIPFVYDMLIALQPLRQRGVKIAVLSRHYFPNFLLSEDGNGGWLNGVDAKTGRRKKDLFDIIISMYTNSDAETEAIIQRNPDRSDIKFQSEIVMANVNNNWLIQRFERNKRESAINLFSLTGKSADLKDYQKYTHVDILKWIMANQFQTPIVDSQIALFDDEKKIYEKKVINKEVHVFVVPSSELYQSLFRNVEYYQIFKNVVSDPVRYQELLDEFSNPVLGMSDQQIAYELDKYRIEYLNEQFKKQNMFLQSFAIATFENMKNY